MFVRMTIITYKNAHITAPGTQALKLSAVWVNAYNFWLAANIKKQKSVHWTGIVHTWNYIENSFIHENIAYFVQ